MMRKQNIMTMPSNPTKPDPEASDLGNLLTEHERDQLLANLHRTLIWVGVQDPDKLDIDADLLREEMEKDLIKPSDLPPEVHPAKGVVDLRHLIWRLIHEKDLTEMEETQIKELIKVLKAKETHDEERLKEARLTREEAHQLFEETAAVIRTLMDLKEILERKEHKTDLGREVVKKKVNDVKRWNAFVDGMEGKN
jgi:vacuolar-type H+-ATPase subunit I/STV1